MYTRSTRLPALPIDQAQGGFQRRTSSLLLWERSMDAVHPKPGVPPAPPYSTVLFGRALWGSTIAVWATSLISHLLGIRAKSPRTRSSLCLSRPAAQNVYFAYLNTKRKHLAVS